MFSNNDLDPTVTVQNGDTKGGLFADNIPDSFSSVVDIKLQQIQVNLDLLTASVTSAANAEAAAIAAQELAELARDLSQVAQGLSENAQVSSEDARDAAIVAQGLSESARDASVVAQGLSEAAQALSESARDSSIVAQGFSEAARDASIAAQLASETAQFASEAARDIAIGEASAASLSASNSATSETNAESSAAAALLSEQNTAVSEANALASANASALSASSALTSKEAAALSETNALASEFSSAASEAASLISRQGAEAAQQATQLLFDSFGDQYLGPYASDPSTDNDGSPLESGDIYWNTTENALRFWSGSEWVEPSTIATNAATSASASASAAASSETNAATSASNSAASASSAATSEVNASISETNAAASESASAASESAALASATSAANSSSAASQSASDASVSESNAAASASAALTSEQNAATSEANALAYSLDWSDFKTNGGSITGEVDVPSLQLTGGTGTQGTLSWNVEEGTADLIVSPDVTYQLGQELGVTARNLSGVTVSNGAIVKVTGASGNKITIELADNTEELGSSETFAVVTETISANGTGHITTNGLVRGLDTSTFVEGVAIWLGANGQFTDVKPQTPAHLVHIGWVVRSHATEGSILVRISNGWEVDELHDVLITNITDNEVLQWNATSGYWENQTLTEAGISSIAYADQSEADAKTYADGIVAAEASARSTGDTNTLTSANTYTDTRETAITTAYQAYSDQSEADAITSANTYTDTKTANSGNWDTAYSWGNHAVQGYATTVYVDQSEADAITVANAYTDGRETAITTAYSSADTVVLNSAIDEATALAIALG